MSGDREPADPPDGEDGSGRHMGSAPSLQGAESIRAQVAAALFGEEPSGDGSPGEGPPDDVVAPTPEGAPEIADRGQRRDRIAARLFGEASPSTSSEGDEGWQVDTEIAADAPPPAADRITEQIEPVVGRFRVLERLGRGGMGVVYSAYDPELDRKVAIKVLRADVRRGLSSDDAQSRLMREAQAMARLNHPNVIVVHEVGTVGERVFVAMEFVDGGTLREWMKTRRPWPEVLDVFLKAGRGLAAAHAAGLVHRDFKPDNVLLGRDGRVRVLDFGLARSLLDSGPEGDTVATASERPEVDTFNTPLTRTGAVMGTPAYMSPEQHLGHRADARSDQFSFCVALYEALYGQRPFAGQDLITLSTNVVRGEMSSPPADVRLPRWIGAAIRRGLSAKARDRFPTMDELLAELERDPRRGWRRVGLGVAVAIVASGATYAAFAGKSTADACGGFDREIAEIWNEETRERLEAAILASDKPYARRVADTTVDLFGQYTGRWRATAEQACATAQVGTDDAARTYAAQRRCLDARLAEVGQLVDALSAGGPGMERQAVPAAADLSDLGACTDAKRLAAWASPGDPAIGDRIAAARIRLASAKAQGALGKYDEAIAIATEVVDEAIDMKSPAVEASALLVRGQYRERVGDFAGAEADLDKVVERADAAGDDGTKAQALTRAVFVISRDNGRYNEAVKRGAEARGVLDTLDAVPLLQADLDGALGAAARATRHYDEALAYHRKALETRERLLGSKHPDTASSLANIGSTLSAAGRLEEAEVFLRRALESLEEVLGDSHPWVGTALGNLGNCLARQGKPAEALPLQERSLAVLEEALGADNPGVVRTRFNLGKLLGELDRYADAQRMLETGLAQRIAEVGDDDETLASWYILLGDNAQEQSRLEDARAYYQRGLDLRTRHGSAAYELTTFEFPIARTYWPSDPARAVAEAKRARDHALVWLETAAPSDKARVQRLVDDMDGWLTAHPLGAPE